MVYLPNDKVDRILRSSFDSFPANGVLSEEFATPIYQHAAADDCVPTAATLTLDINESFSNAVPSWRKDNGMEFMPMYDGWNGEMQYIEPDFLSDDFRSTYTPGSRTFDRVLRDGDQDDKITIGDPPNKAGAPRLNQKVGCEIYGSVWLDESEKKKTLIPKDCSNYSETSKDDCFLSVVGVVQLLSDNKQLRVTCSGTIIDSNSVLTAAHCVCEDPPEYLLVGTTVPSFVSLFSRYDPIEFSKYNLQADRLVLPYETARQFGMSAALLSVNPTFQDFCDQGLRPDLAIIRLKEGLTFPQSYSAVLIDTPQIYTNINIAGFGPDPSTTYAFEQKRYASSSIISVSENYIMLEARSGANTCPGDSGSGAYVRLKNGKLGVFGVLAGGPETGCRQGGVSQYTPISGGKNFQWIQSRSSGLEYQRNVQYADDFDRCIAAINC